jgi:hypothetical protein
VLNLTVTRTQKQLLKNNLKITEHKLKESRTIDCGLLLSHALLRKRRCFLREAIRGINVVIVRRENLSHEIKRYRIQFHEILFI